jgi:hypothetical protein
MQTSVNINQAKAIVGMLADLSKNYVVSKNAIDEAIPYGRGVVKALGIDSVCRLPKNNQLVITDDAGTFTAGSIVTTIVHGADSTSTVITTAFITDKDTSMTAHAAAILAALSDGYSCAYVGGSTHTITLLMKSEDIVSSSTSVTGITGNMTISSEVVSCADTAADLLGVAVMDHNREQQLVTGTTQYAIGEPVNVLKNGAVYVYSEEAVTPDDTVYYRIVTNSTKIRGMFGKSSDSSKCVALTGVKFADTITAAGIVKLVLNLPQ